MSREFFIEDDGVRIHLKLDLPENSDVQSENGHKLPILIVIHGITGHMEEDHIRAIAHSAVEAGFASLRAEMYGHGQSGGTFPEHTLFKWINNAMTVIDYARSLPFVSDLYLCGHSQGGLLTMLVGGMEHDRLRAILPISPAWMIPETSRRGEVLGLFFDPVHIPDQVVNYDGKVLNGNYIRVAQTINAEEAIRKFPGPVLLLHGSADDSVPLHYSRKAAELYACARLVVIPGAMHNFENHLEEVKAAVRAFLLDVREGRFPG